MSKNTVAHFIGLRAIDQSYSVLLSQKPFEIYDIQWAHENLPFSEAQMTCMQYTLSTIECCCSSTYMFIMHKPLFQMFHSRTWIF